MNKKLLAKSDGTKLLKHSMDVESYSLNLYKLSCKEEDEDIKKSIRLAALLHDIGKSTTNFQRYLKGELKKPNNKYLHNQISWAFLARYFNFKKFSSKVKRYSLNAIYWHHGVVKKEKLTSRKIIETVSEKDIETMKEIIKFFFGEEYIIKNRKINSPEYYYIDNEDFYNEDLTYIRTCVISADRFISKGYKYENKKINNFLFDKCPFEDDKRFKNQKNIVNDCDNTTIIKAPTGFGKTMLGLLWSEKSDKKLLWVCPRNSVAFSTYNSILREFENADKKVNVELYYSGETQKCNFDKEKESYDILITNIDYYLKPYGDNGSGEKLFFIAETDVVFDEYHELVTREAMFQSFVNIMYVRHNLTNSKTLLLSATPILLNEYWDTYNNNTTILPNKENHYKAIHNKKYKLNVINKLPIINNDELVVLNSITNSQKLAKYYPNAEIIHSRFLDDVKENKLKKIIDLYGKNSRQINRYPFIGNMIIQASLDISFKKITESVISPEYTLQRIGRCNRWGRYNTGVINLWTGEHNGNMDRGELSAINYLYNNKLRNKWLDHLYENDGKLLTLDEIYNIYNDFINKNKEEIFNYIENLLEESHKNMCTHIYPIKYFNEYGNDDTPENKEITAGSNKLRSTGNEIFYTVKNQNNEWVGPFNMKLHKSIKDEFKEEGNVLNKFLKILKKDFKNNENSLFDYGQIHNKRLDCLTIDDLRYMARKSSSPYFALKFHYHERYGVIK